MPKSDKERLLELLDALSEKEISVLKNLVESLADTSDAKRTERGYLKVTESALSEWDNEEDDIYNDL